MIIDFSEVDEVRDFVAVPEGEYLARIAEVRPGTTRDGNPRWGLRLVVADGDYAGRTAAWDALVWSERGLPRVKEVLRLLGFDVSGRVEVEPADLQGRELRAQFVSEAWEDPVTGQRQTRLRVPYRGYAAPP